MSSIVLANALLRDISKRYEDADDYDVNLYVGEEPEIEVFQAHSFILRARSAYFRAALSNNWVKKENDKISFRKPNISPKLFGPILKYMYTSSIELNIESVNRQEYFELIAAADELTLTELVDHIQEHIISNEKGWLLENFVQVFQKISTYEAMRKLQDYCAELICNDPSVVFTSDFGSLEEPALLALLQRDDLVMDEIDIWECVIKWGLAKNKVIDPDVTKWSQRDFEAMERTLHNCIQYIRFFQIPAHEYFYKVRPYKKILPRNLKEDLQLYYIVPLGQPKYTSVLPPRMGLRPDSVIITSQHAAIIANWIYNKPRDTYKPHEIPYHFKLLIRGSRDGFTQEDFHKRCDHKGANIVVVKVEGAPIVIGGYNPLGWTSANDWRQTTESFIFSLNKQLKTTIMGRVRNPNCAIRDTVSKQWIGFGVGDLHFLDGTCTPNDYDAKILDSARYVVEDYEVFQVLNKSSNSMKDRPSKPTSIFGFM